MMFRIPEMEALVIGRIVVHDAAVVMAATFPSVCLIIALDCWADLVNR